MTMTQKQPKKTHHNPPQTAKKKRMPKLYVPEIMYQYWAAAGGKVLEAMRLAEDAGEDRVPSDRHTWAEYALQHNFAGKLKEEEDKRWEEFHAEREKNQQHVLDEIAHTFEGVMNVFCRTLKEDIEALHSGDPKRARQAERRLSKLFGSIEAIDRFYRMYFRARELPEHLNQQTVKNSSKAIGVDELQEEDDWAESADEARRETEDE